MAIDEPDWYREQIAGQMLGMQQQQLGLEQSLSQQRLAAQQYLDMMQAAQPRRGLGPVGENGTERVKTRLIMDPASCELNLDEIITPSWGRWALRERRSFAVRKQTIGMMLSAISLILTALWVWGMGW